MLLLLLLLLLSGGPVATAAAAASRRRNSAIGQSAGCAGLSLAQTERWSNQSRKSRPPPRASQLFIIVLGVMLSGYEGLVLVLGIWHPIYFIATQRTSSVPPSCLCLYVVY